MKYVRHFLSSRRARRVHRVTASVALLVLWALVGPTQQVMHTGAFLTAELWIGFADLCACLLLGTWNVPPKRHSAPRSTESAAAPAAPVTDLKKAA